MYYINSFFIYSFLGNIFETILSFFTKQKFNSGILRGPLTPIYGIGVILIILISKSVFANLHLSRLKETIIVFFILIFTLTLLEWLGGILIEKLFGVIYWDYSRFPLHIGHYISVEISLLWGILSILFIYVIKPIIDPLVKSIPSFVTIGLLLILGIDIIVTIMHFKK